MKNRKVHITLKWPVKLQEGVLNAVDMRRPTVGDLLANPIKDNMDLAGEAALYAALCDMNPEDFNKLDAEDYGEIQRQFLLFRGISEKKRTDEAGTGVESTDESCPF